VTGFRSNGGNAVPQRATGSVADRPRNSQTQDRAATASPQRQERRFEHGPMITDSTEQLTESGRKRERSSRDDLEGRSRLSQIHGTIATFGKQESGSVCGLFSGLKVTLQFSPNGNLTYKHPANSLFGKPEMASKKPFMSR
jgi:hypothetical protein